MTDLEVREHLARHLATTPTGAAEARPRVEPAEVLDWLRADRGDGLRRVLAEAYLRDADGRYWPTDEDPAALWRIVWGVLIAPEPQHVPTCPDWCREHFTRRRHSVHDVYRRDPGRPPGYTTTHEAWHGEHVAVQLEETALTGDGPTIANSRHLVLYLVSTDQTLTVAQARTLAAHLIAAANHLDQIAGLFAPMTQETQA